MFNGDDNAQEEFIALKNDSITEEASKDKNSSAFWSTLVPLYPKLQAYQFDFRCLFVNLIVWGGLFSTTANKGQDQK